MEEKKELDYAEVLKQEIISTRLIPDHVAIIMDGNGRWAKQRHLPRVAGHKEGINSVREVVKAAGEIGIRFLTLYTFSTENWLRPAQEVSALMSLLVQTLREELDELRKNNVRLQVLGHLEDLPFLPRQGMLHAISALKENTGLRLNLALSYSSRREMVDAIKQIAQEVAEGALAPDAIDEQVIKQHLYTAGIPDPDLLIRTSGEMRISNFLLWQLAYTEIFVTDLLWPDFRRCQFYEAIRAFQQRERRFGKVSEQIVQNSSSIDDD